jgi:hypothetical protein
MQLSPFNSGMDETSETQDGDNHSFTVVRRKAGVGRAGPPGDHTTDANKCRVMALVVKVNY